MHTAKALNLTHLMSALFVALTVTIALVTIGLPLWAILPVYSASGAFTLIGLSLKTYRRLMKDFST
jgi:hypothetical protein